MPVTLTIKQVPEKLAARLRARASANHRSLQGELMAIVHAAADDTRPAVAEKDSPRYAARESKEVPSGQETAALTLAELWEEGRRRGLDSPSESARIIRKTRDERFGG